MLPTGTYTKEASCILSNLRNRVMRLFCQIPSIDIALINLLKSCMEYRCIYSTLIKLLGSFPALVEAILCMPQSALPGPVHARPVSCKAQPLTGFVLVFPRGNADFAGSRLRIKEIGSQAPASETEAGEGLNVRRCGV